MNNDEARTLLTRRLAEYRVLSYSELAALVDSETDHSEVLSGGVTYQLDVRVIWDGRSGGDVRVLGAVDDGGWRAFLPLTDSFIKAPDGSFVDE